MQFLKELTLLSGVSGNEKEVRDFVLDKIKGKADSVTIDTLGNVIAKKNGRLGSKKTVMVASHMDEVGLICANITDDGCLKFKEVGGIDPRVLVSKRVSVGENKIAGIIGFKAVHLQSAEERTSPVKMDSLYIDIGAKSKEEAEKVVKKGDYITFKSDYRELGDKNIKAKALDDRVGVSIMLKLIECDYDYDTFFVFTVQEEVGLRGAKVAANRLAPDVALVLEATTCSDVFGVKEDDVSTKLGQGAVLSYMDRATMYNKELTDMLKKLAEENDILHQFKRTTAGGNDSGAIHVAAAGVKTVAISVPARYIHSPASVISKSDYMQALALAKTFLKEIASYV